MYSGSGSLSVGEHPVELWIGLHDRDSEAGCGRDMFMWTDATPTHYEAWSAGEPNDW